MKIRNALLVFACLSLICSVSSAEDKENARPWLSPKADLNKDGKIDVEEAQKAEEAWKNMKRDAWKARQEERKEKVAEKKEEWKEQRQEWVEKKEEKRQEWVEKHPGNTPPPGLQGRSHTGPHHDKDNNPPGMAGGPGTNWENVPGPKGGPGAGPDKKGFAKPHHRDRDNNPPGMKGGPGTNWENKPGPQGGPGASPNRGGGPKKQK